MTPEPNLAELSDNDLIAHLRCVYRRSQQCTAELIRSLVAVNERRLHLKTANPSLFEFCTRKLRMGESSAYRYSTAARLAMQFPNLIERIASGALHLSTLLQLKNHLTPENVDELLEVARGRTAAQVQELLASTAPRPDVPSRMRKLPTPRQQQSVAPVERSLQPLAPERYRVQFNADRETHDEIVRARDLMRHSNPNGDLDRLMKFCVHAGVERLESRQRGLVRRRGPRTTDRAKAPTSRHIPRAVRRAVFERDGAQCTFHDADGNRCPATTLLELDHVDPYAAGGMSTAANLRVRCRPHNAYYAEQYFGKAFIEKRVRARHAEANQRPSAATGTNGVHESLGVHAPLQVASPVVSAIAAKSKGLKTAKEPRDPKARGSSAHRRRTAMAV